MTKNAGRQKSETIHGPVRITERFQVASCIYPDDWDEIKSVVAIPVYVAKGKGQYVGEVS